MNVALIGDVHANLPALEAVLADARARSVSAVWNVGDVVGYGAFPDESVRMLRAAGAVSIVGNYDRKVLRFPRKAEKWQRSKASEKYAAFEWAYRNLSPESRDYLASLPTEVRMQLAGREFLLVHGSPTSEDEPLTDETPAGRLEELAELAAADVVVCGHSHKPMAREAAGVLFVGTGSVGRPEGGDPRACYAVLEIDAGQLAVTHRRVPYDAASAAEAIRSTGQPEAFAQMVLRGESFDGITPQRDLPDPAEAPPVHPRDAEAAVLALAERCSYEDDHTRQVVRISEWLFDALRPAHGLGDRERDLMRWGAWLHDIGWLDGKGGHHKSSLRRILADPSLPFDTRSRYIVASVARYHRKALPKKRHGHYMALDADDRELVRVLGGIVRLADGLDRTHDDVVTGLACEIAPHEVVIRCRTAGPADIALEAARRKSELLSLALGRGVRIEAEGHVA